jgi:septum formation protein
MRLMLASASPRRAALLSAAGFTFEVRPAGVDERMLPGEAPAAYVRRMALQKSAAAQAEHGAADPGGDLVVLAADTAVVVDGRVLGKPADAGEAREMLECLSGRAHQVLTGVSVRKGAVELGAVETTTVWFSPLAASDIAWYVGSGEGGDKAGGYAIQGLASRFIPRIEGSYSNVVGLPVARVVQLLAELDGGSSGARR